MKHFPPFPMRASAFPAVKCRFTGKVRVLRMNLKKVQPIFVR